MMRGLPKQSRGNFLGLMLVLIPLWALAGEDHAAAPASGLEWLAGMRKAASTLTYQGVVAYIKDQQVDSFKLYHQVRDGHEQERLVAMNSPYREVVRTDGNLARYTGENQRVVVETKPASQSVLINLPEDSATLERLYRVHLRGREYIAGALTQVVALEPKDGYRYSRLLWIDTETCLPLKLDVLNEDGQSVEQMVFTTIDTRNPIAPEDLQPSSRTQSAVTQVSHREARPLESLNWSLRRVPEGFQIVSYSLFMRPPANQPIEHVLLSDGFSTVSVYIEKRGNPVNAGAYRLGAVNVETAALSDHVVTVMGEVPAKTVGLIASGIQPKAPAP